MLTAVRRIGAGRLAAAVALVLVCVGFAVPARAQALPEEAGAERTVRMFDLFCFALLPDLETIGEIAGEHFEELTGTELDRYQPQVPAEELRAWRFVDFEQEYVLTTARATPDEQFRSENPEFAESTSYACSLVLPAQDAPDDVRAEMVALMEREPDDTWEEGTLKANEWSGQTEQMMVNVAHYGSVDDKPGGLLSSIAFVLP